jgi:hypothetical protein
MYERGLIINRNRGTSKFLYSPISAIVSAIHSGLFSYGFTPIRAQAVIDFGDKYMLPSLPESMIYPYPVPAMSRLFCNRT